MSEKDRLNEEAHKVHMAVCGEVKISERVAVIEYHLAAAEERGRRAGIEERETLRTYALALRQQVEDTILVAKTDTDGEWITAYHFQTGAMHRLLAKAREPLIALVPPSIASTRDCEAPLWGGADLCSCTQALAPRDSGKENT